MHTPPPREDTLPEHGLGQGRGHPQGWLSLFSLMSELQQEAGPEGSWQAERRLHGLSPFPNEGARRARGAVRSHRRACRGDELHQPLLTLSPPTHLHLPTLTHLLKETQEVLPLATQRVVLGLAPSQSYREMQDFSLTPDLLNSEPSFYLTKSPDDLYAHTWFEIRSQKATDPYQQQSPKNLHALILDTFTQHLTCARSAHGA